MPRRSASTSWDTTTRPLSSTIPCVRSGLTGQGIVWAFTDGLFGEWYPLAMLSHMLDCELFGLNPHWHHLTSVLLHAAAAIGLFHVLRSMTGELWPSAFVACCLPSIRNMSKAWSGLPSDEMF